MENVIEIGWFVSRVTDPPPGEYLTTVGAVSVVTIKTSSPWSGAPAVSDPPFFMAMV
jgi:hypothetical protein